MKRRRFVFGAAAIAATGAGVLAAASSRRIGIIYHETREAATQYEPILRRHLSEFGYVEGKNLVLEPRYGGEGSSESQARDLVRSGAEIIVVTGGTNPTLAAQKATRTVPILTMVGDPVGSGFATSLARPGAPRRGHRHVQRPYARFSWQGARALPLDAQGRLGAYPARRAEYPGRGLTGKRKGPRRGPCCS